MTTPAAIDDVVGPLQALLEKATPGPWRSTGLEYEPEAGWFIRESGDGRCMAVARVCGTYRSTEEIEATAALIVAAVNALPSILALITSLAKERDEARKEDEETYAIGKRDGYEFAVQCIDIATGGDGEYRYCMGEKDWPETHCPDAGSMQIRISNRLSAATARARYAEREVERVREVLQAVSDDILHARNHGAIVDTVWHSDIETTVDFIAAALSPVGGVEG